VLDAMMKIHAYTMLCAPITAQMAALEALRHGDRDVEEMVADYDRRRRLLVKGLNDLGLRCPLPGGAFYAFSVRRLDRAWIRKPLPSACFTSSASWSSPATPSARAASATFAAATPPQPTSSRRHWCVSARFSKRFESAPRCFKTRIFALLSLRRNIV
jgi:hypothetical protein